MNKKIFSLIIVLVYFITIPLCSQMTKRAQVGFRFLDNPVSAEVVGRGTVGVTTTLNSNGLFWNPALISWGEEAVDVSLNYTKGIADINYNAFAASLRLGDFGVLGASLLTMDYGTFYGTRRALNDAGYVETGEFSPTAFAAGLAFSQKVSNRFSYGIHVKYVYQDLGDAWVGKYGTTLGDTNLNMKQASYNLVERTKTVPFAIDVGAYYDFLYKGIRFGATIQNISREYHYENEDFPMPFAVSFGATIEPLKFLSEDQSPHKVIVAFESKHPRDFNEKLKFGLEYSFESFFTIRLGQMLNYDERGLTAGVGFRQTLEGVPLRIDYAYEAFGIFGGRHYISLGFGY